MDRLLAKRAKETGRTTGRRRERDAIALGPRPSACKVNRPVIGRGQGRQPIAGAHRASLLYRAGQGTRTLKRALGCDGSAFAGSAQPRPPKNNCRFPAADEIFSTGNFAKVVPVIRIDDGPLTPGSFYARAWKLYLDFAASREPSSVGPPWSRRPPWLARRRGRFCWSEESVELRNFART